MASRTIKETHGRYDPALLALWSVLAASSGCGRTGMTSQGRQADGGGWADAAPDSSAVVSDTAGGCCEVGIPTCASYAVTGPPGSLPVPSIPSARSGNNYAVLSTVNTKMGWSGADRSYWYDVTFSLLDPRAGVSSPATTAFRFRGNDDAGMTADYGVATPLVIIAHAGGYAIAWSTYRQGVRDLWSGRVDAVGAGLGTPQVLDDRFDDACALAGGGTHLGAAWRSSGGALRFALLDEELVVVASTEVTPRSYLGPVSLFWDGGGYGLFWENILQNLDEVRFARLDPSGTPLVAPMQLNSPDTHGGGLLIEPVEDGYIAYWHEMPTTASGLPQAALHKLGKDGQALEPARALSTQGCSVAALTRSGSELGVLCADNNAIGFAGLGTYESNTTTPVLPIGLPVPTRDGVRVASVANFQGHDGLFDIFWMGSVDGANWVGDYFTQVHCAQ